jgi:23S rRNA (guanosine2251-2'-O)-methyltransferase
MKQKLRNEELKRLSVEEFKEAHKQPITVILDNVRSLHNVGSVFRTADAFLIEEVLLCGVTGTPPNKEIEKTALGATSSVSWRHFKKTEDAVSYCRERRYTIYAIEQANNSLPLNIISPGDEKMALIFGNEVYGVSQEVVNVSDAVVEIPQLGTKHSLNIAVSVGIVLWEILRGKQALLKK